MSDRERMLPAPEGPAAWRPLLPILLVAAIVFAVGWNAFRFQCDDAFIAFRHADQAMRGHGPVWNPSPFLPVEGCTSFLWVLLLVLTWKFIGVEPPVAADALGFLFAFAQLLLVARYARPAARTPAGAGGVAFALALALCVTNRSFLAWGSSGLEAPLFNLLVLAWCGLAAAGAGALPTMGCAALLALTRPDGYLFLATSTLAAAHAAWRAKPGAAAFVPFLPLALPCAHLAGRLLYYGEWLPNTYHAKVDGSRYALGFTHLASFTLEHGCWVLLLGAGACLPELIRRSRRNGFSPSDAGVALAVLTLAAHAGFYVRIGGDHFEYRVFSHLIPLCAVASGRLVAHASRGTLHAVALALALLLPGLPLPWAHWFATRHLSVREETLMLRAPVAPLFPTLLNAPARLFDALQDSLISRLVCVRHQEHKVFLAEQMRRFGPRAPRAAPGRRPVVALHYVGYPGWAMPDVAILDQLGLCDHVTARHEARGRSGLLAHDRYPPDGYLESFGIPAGAASGDLPDDREVRRIERSWRQAAAGRARVIGTPGSRRSAAPSAAPEPVTHPQTAP